MPVTVHSYGRSLFRKIILPKGQSSVMVRVRVSLVRVRVRLGRPTYETRTGHGLGKRCTRYISGGGLVFNIEVYAIYSNNARVVTSFLWLKRPIFARKSSVLILLWNGTLVECKYIFMVNSKFSTWSVLKSCFIAKLM